MKKKSLEDYKKLCREYLEGWQRARADFLNYKKEEAGRIEEILNLLKSEWILEMLKIHDNLERAREHVPEELKNNEWTQGIFQIEEQFHKFFKEQGLERLNPKGEKFDPDLHQAVEQVETKDKESGTIIEVLEKGYKINGRLLRPAKVRVAK